MYRVEIATSLRPSYVVWAVLEDGFPTESAARACMEEWRDGERVMRVRGP